MGSQAAAEHDTMVSFPSLDLLLLTFNCAKSAIDVPVFAGHLQEALSAKATGTTGTTLPDLVVFSLQEAGPLGHAFVGSYFLSPYLARFDEALNQAASELDGNRADNGDEGEEEASVQAAARADADAAQTPLVATQRGGATTKPYRLIRQANVGMTAVLLFARDAALVRSVEVAECGFGVADMGNKGAVGLRVAYGAAGSNESELTFVATHLAAMEWNVRRRNANWRSIVAGLTFGNPRDAIAAAGAEHEPGSLPALGRGRQGRTRDEAASAPQSPEEEAEADAADAAGDDAWLLLGGDGGQDQGRAAGTADSVVDQANSRLSRSADIRRRLHDMSIFRPDSLLFVAGDLNYRTDAARPPAGALFPTADTWPSFLAHDQLNEERLAGRTFHGMREAAIAFPPTYKFDVLEGAEAETEAQNAAEIRAWRETHANGADGSRAPVPCKYASHRWPSWCDRVLYLDVSAGAKRRWLRQSGGEVEPEVQIARYTSLPLMRTSDHQPVFLRARVPLLGRRGVQEADESGSGSGSGSESEENPEAETTRDVCDPRSRLPVPIDTDAWDRRAQARRRELLAGCGMLLFNTQGGAIAIATAVVLTVGAYWFWAGMVQ